ncbi:hypothetical protein B5P41_02965 [Bacillus sp. SRB_28]|nr:hypothetical protein B5P41_02965 [Bacillus sp. SRB_28]
MIAPILITGTMYDVTKSSGELLAAELIVRTLSLIIGLLVISKALYRYSQSSFLKRGYFIIRFNRIIK